MSLCVVFAFRLCRFCVYVQFVLNTRTYFLSFLVFIMFGSYRIVIVSYRIGFAFMFFLRSSFVTLLFFSYFFFLSFISFLSFLSQWLVFTYKHSGICTYILPIYIHIYNITLQSHFTLISNHYGYSVTTMSHHIVTFTYVT